MPVISTQGRRVTVYTIGCRLNQAESALLSDRFAHFGFVPVSLGEQTDVAEDHPGRVAEMTAKLHAWYGEVDAKFLQARPDGPQPWRP